MAISSASVSCIDFRLDHGIARKSVSPSLKLLDHLGLIEIEPGPRLVNVFRFSNRWRTVDEVEAKRLAALARELKPHRTFERRREHLVKSRDLEPKPRNGAKVRSSPPKPMTLARSVRPSMQRRVPSLPTMPWQDRAVMLHSPNGVHDDGDRSEAENHSRDPGHVDDGNPTICHAPSSAAVGRRP
ncbi:hypothetical protein [Bradyrhizobium valentinum]|uniref:Uncharacterized protein n=1 Tax=Bradyrhizobium valentinum TaxID=1518501 RepID=A0A0R3M3C4_9BRAD|nr:hypothetical protein [Bradyrhizobium valentinum]KRR14756.1 hypothetical protein CP49_31075 [Bradyrhizobium valentinum]